MRQDPTPEAVIGALAAKAHFVRIAAIGANCSKRPPPAQKDFYWAVTDGFS